MQDAASENGAQNNSTGGGGGNGGDAVRADDLSVDQIVNSLLDDPKIASGMLSSFSARPSVLGGGMGVPSRAGTALRRRLQRASARRDERCGARIPDRHRHRQLSQPIAWEGAEGHVNSFEIWKCSKRRTSPRRQFATFRLARWTD